jgi:hypothetical protein
MSHSQVRFGRAAAQFTLLGAAWALILGIGIARADQVNSPHPRPRTPLGIYAVVPVDDAADNECYAAGARLILDGQALLNACLQGFYTDLLNNKAVSGLALQVYWTTLNPNPPTSPNPYSWDYVDDAFSSVNSWNSSNPGKVPKTIQLIVTPGFNSPQWMLDELTDCDGLFASPAVIPADTCGKATFTSSKEPAAGDVLPMPWNPTYQAAWRTFLQALQARYNAGYEVIGGGLGGNPLVSIAVAGPTAASAEMLLPNGYENDQTPSGGPATSANCMWDELLALEATGNPDSWSCSGTDAAFSTAWDDAIDTYASIFGDLTLIVTTGDGLPNLALSFPVVPTTPYDFTSDCPSPNMDCQAETSVLAYFAQPVVGGANAKATQTSGMEASRVGLNLGIDAVQLLSRQSATSARILGGAQFNTQVSNYAAQEGCLATFPPTKDFDMCKVPAGGFATQNAVTVECIPQMCLAPGATLADLQSKKLLTYGAVKKNDPQALISPEQAAYNVLEDFFTGAPTGGPDFVGMKGGAPLNYLQIYYEDIEYATNNQAKAGVSVKHTGGTVKTETLETLLEQASAQLTKIAE